jgi:4'-phosphopantetheinyl transferase EntD
MDTFRGLEILSASRPCRCPGSCTGWLAFSPVGEKSHWPELSEPEQQHLETLGSPQRKKEWAAGRIAARLALGEIGRFSGSILSGSDGAPELVPNPNGLSISISHTRQVAAAVAFENGRSEQGIGIDLVSAEDQVRIRSIRRRIFSSEEYALVDQHPDALPLAWALKEAAAKATRTGMFRFALENVRLLGPPDSSGALKARPHGLEAWAFRLEDGSLGVVAQTKLAPALARKRV